MVPVRRSQPFWRSIAAPTFLGLLWPSALCGFWFFFVSEFGSPLAAEAVSFTEGETVAIAPVSSQLLAQPEGHSHAFLELAGKVVVDQELTHLGQLQLEAEGNFLAFDLLPTGTETASLGQIRIFNVHNGEQAASFAGYAPKWNAQGGLDFNSPQGAAMSFDLSTEEFSAWPEVVTAAVGVNQPPVSTDPSKLVPFQPTTIRVRHRDLNHCRPGTPVDQVDVIPIEEYVARVLPAEVPPSWNMGALKAQAIAARTYAINHIYHKQDEAYPFDVSDWANNQMMCDYRHERTDQAAAETAGMILSPIVNAERLPINAMYSAENGHPTRKHGYLEYLDSVPDVNALGQERRGHGWGLSQLGAQRLANQGLNFCQILGHYYQNVHLNDLADPDEPVGCLEVNDQSGFATGAGLYIRALTGTVQDELSVTINKVSRDAASTWTTLAPVVEKQTVEETETPSETESNSLEEVVEEPNPGNEEEVDTPDELPVPAWPLILEIPEGELIWYFPNDVSTGDVLEIELKSGEQSLHSVFVEVDHVGPQHLDFGLLETSVPDVPQLSAVAAPGDSVSVGRDWRWEQSALYFSENSGELVLDANATDGILWLGDPDRHQSGSWYGPYTSVLPGGESYRALFKAGIGRGTHLEKGAIDAALPVARFDVAIEKGVKVLGLREVYLTDFRSEVGLISFPVDFHLFESAEDLEFRVTWYGNYPFAFDNVSVVTLPFSDWAHHPLPLPLVPDSPFRDLRIVAFDEADNMSTLFSLHLGSAPNSQPTSFEPGDCSWLGDCREAAIDMDMPSAVE